MNLLRLGIAAAVATSLLHAAAAQQAAPAPAFDVAYRAWEIVTELARHNGDPRISGECGKTFRPFVIPGLRRQTKPDEELAAVACVEAARSACGNGQLRRTAETAARCAEFSQPRDARAK